MATRGRRRGRRKSDPVDQLLTGLIIKVSIALTVVVVVLSILSAVLEALGPHGIAILIVALLAVVGVRHWLDLRRKRKARAQRLERAIWQAKQDRHLATADVMTGTEFEHVVRRLLIRDGFESVRVAGGAGDRGADVIGQSPGGHRVVVQCKRYLPTRSVTSPEMQLFVAMAWHEHKAQRALYVTTAKYTEEARRIAAKHDIYLIGRGELGRWMSGGTAFGTAVAPTPAPS